MFIREAYGRLWGFLYGWTRFFVASTGGIAGLAAGFAIFLNIASRRGAATRRGLTFPIGGRRRCLDRRFTLVAAGAIVRRDAGQLRRGGGRRPDRVGARRPQDCARARASASARSSWRTATGRNFALSAAGSSCDGVPAAARGGVAGFGAAMLGAMWAYNGWNEVTYVAGEVKDPQRNLPLAIIGGIGIVATLYIFANVAYFYVLAPAAVAERLRRHRRSRPRSSRRFSGRARPAA